jgi:hypothetical protein
VVQVVLQEEEVEVQEAIENLPVLLLVLLQFPL